MSSDATALLAEFDKQHGAYESFYHIVNRLIEDLLKANGLSVHTVTARAKGRDSFARKIAKPTKDYKSLREITDICGARIITHFNTDVDAVAKVIEREFAVDYRNSIDKRVLLDPDAFGYMSLHYVCRLSEERAALAEYAAFADMPVEIQIRSILQHAWAEIEHDLGYKSKTAIPIAIRRKFSRVAGLLESADEAFSEIRDYLSEYQASVAEAIRSHPENVLLDRISASSILDNDNLVHDIAIDIAKSLGFDTADSSKVAVELERRTAVSSSPDAPRYFPALDNMVAKLNYVNIRTVTELLRELENRRQAIIRFADIWVHYMTVFGAKVSEFSEHIHWGWPLVFLPYVVILQTGEPELVKKQKLREFVEFENREWGSGKEERVERLSNKMFEEYANRRLA